MEEKNIVESFDDFGNPFFDSFSALIELEERELEKNKTDIRRMLERKKATGENIKDIAKDSRMQLKRRT